MSNQTMPAGWVQLSFPFTKVITTNVVGDVKTTKDFTSSYRNILVAWDPTNKGQLDGIIGVQKTTVVTYAATKISWDN